MSLFEVQDAKKLFRQGQPNEVRAVDGVTFEIEQGGFLVLCGPSGSGKSTLLGLLGALERPTSGDICFDGSPFARASDVQLGRLRRRMAFVFQDFAMLPKLSVIDNIHYALIPRRIPARERLETATRLLDRLELSHFAAGRADELSGGERQRLALARALAVNPEVLLADEPTSNLDRVTADIVLTLLVEYCEQGGTVVAATHDEELLQHAHRVLRLEAGKLVADERP